MSAFRVGQRVRILWSINWPELAGQEGRIVGRAEDDGELEDLDCEWDVAPDIWGDFIRPDGDAFSPHSSQLEPILPEGAAPSTWAECVWQPEHMRATA